MPRKMEPNRIFAEALPQILIICHEILVLEGQPLVLHSLDDGEKLLFEANRRQLYVVELVV